ncbi:hypothetical protein D3C76_1379750 [compost metagenome]
MLKYIDLIQNVAKVRFTKLLRYEYCKGLKRNTTLLHSLQSNVKVFLLIKKQGRIKLHFTQCITMKVNHFIFHPNPPIQVEFTRFR